MAFRALLFSKSPETGTSMSLACKAADIRLEICTDIFSAIEKAKTQSFSCIIPDWVDQPEASFLLKRARESAANRETVAIAVVDNEPTAAEMHDNRLDFLIYRPISVEEADAVLTKAREGMRPSSVADLTSSEDMASSANADAGAGQSAAAPQSSVATVASSHETASTDENVGELETDAIDDESIPGTFRGKFHGIGARGAIAALLILTAAFCLWKSRGVIDYLSHTREDRMKILHESFASLFYMNSSGATPLGSAGSDAQQDAYFSRGSSLATNDADLKLGVASTEDNLADNRMPLHKAADYPIPVAEYEAPILPPVHVQRAAIPESMMNSSPIERPVVVTVNPAQMLPVSNPLPQPSVQQFNEPVAISEQEQRALLVHSVDPQYPAEAAGQKLHGPVVLQALIGRDGAVEDLKIVRGYFILGRAAIAAVKQWRFQPYNLNGHAAATQTQLTINFNGPAS
jgi:TonB family protein